MFTFNKKVEVSETGKAFGTGWLCPLPDLRDYTESKSDLDDMLKKLHIKSKATIPKQVDLRKWCSPVEDQGDLGSCTAHAAAGIVEYFQTRTSDKHIEGSRLFVYKATRNLMGVEGDTGAWLRTTMGALVLCGIPPERYWPYTDQAPGFDEEPTSFVYAVAENYEAIKYFCHDPMGLNIPPKVVLERVKRYLVAGIPSMFGFFGFSSFNETDIKGGIPYPCSGEQAKWGHAIVTVGYDDERKIKNKKSGKSTEGALLIRNSWGTYWGEDGYGWLPYAYVLKRLALDFWSLLSMDWVDTAKFGIKKS